MMYNVYILNKTDGDRHQVSVSADNYPDAVKDAMIRLGKKLGNGAHLVEDPRRKAPRL